MPTIKASLAGAQELLEGRGPCKKCGSETCIKTGCGEPGHWGLYCTNEMCRHYVNGKKPKQICWVTQDKNIGKRSSKTTGKAKGFFCEMCLKITEEHERLIGHHVIEDQDDGTGKESNIWDLCVHCHNVVHAIRDIRSANIGELVKRLKENGDPRIKSGK